MAHRIPDAHYERKPHIHGPQAFRYRYGTAVRPARVPPSWSPEMAHDRDYPYYADQYAKGVRDWVAATEVPEHRQGQMLIWALGGQARKFFEGMNIHEKQYGAELDDGQGQVVRVRAVDFILGVLEAHFPVHEETRVLRTGLDFFNFVPRRSERPGEWFLRFDNMLGEANRVAELELSITFRSWMLPSLLPLPTKKWSELLKDMQHGLLRTRREYIDLQPNIIREKVLENSIFDLRGHARNVVGADRGRGAYFSETESVEPRPLFLCLGDPGGSLLVGGPDGVSEAGSSGGVDLPIDGHYLLHIGSNYLYFHIYLFYYITYGS